MHEKLKKALEVNRAIQINHQSALLRQSIINSFNNTQVDKMDCEFKWPNQLVFDDFFRMYKRNAIAKRGCNLPVNLGWMDEPDIIEGKEANKNKEVTAWENQTRKLFKKLNIYKSIKSADMKQRVGRYSALLIQVRGSQGLDWSMPLTKISTSQIVKLIPVYEGQLTPTETWPASDERYPMPMRYQFNEQETEDRENQLTARSLTIHASRVIPLSENADIGELNGISAIEGCYNNLLDINRILGSTAIGLYRANAAKMVLTSDNGKMPNDTEREAIGNSINEMLNNTNAHGFIGGLTINELKNNIPSGIKDVFNNEVNMCAANFDLPATVLIGQQTGRLASDEDSKSLAMQSNARRNNWQSFAVERVIDWLDFYCTDFKKPEEISIVWSDMLAPSQMEKLEMMKKAVESFKIFADATQGDQLMVKQEIRSIFELEEIDEPDIDEMVDDEDTESPREE